jgi:hypothetical protein
MLTNRHQYLRLYCLLCLQRLELMMSATAKSGGVYLYANQQGCDGGRLYFDGCAAVVVNGSLVAQVRWGACHSRAACRQAPPWGAASSHIGHAPVRPCISQATTSSCSVPGPLPAGLSV